MKAQSKRSAKIKCILRSSLALLSFILLAAGAQAENNGSQIVGLWFADLDVVPGAPINQSQIMMNVIAHGTLTTNDTDDYTGINPALSATGFTVNGNGQGVWKRTGGRNFAVTYHFFEYAGTGAGAGLLTNLARIRCNVEVHGDAMDGSCDADFYFATDADGDGIPNSPNPAVDAPDFTFPGIWEIHGTRLGVE